MKLRLFIIVALLVFIAAFPVGQRNSAQTRYEPETVRVILTQADMVALREASAGAVGTDPATKQIVTFEILAPDGSRSIDKVVGGIPLRLTDKHGAQWALYLKKVQTDATSVSAVGTDPVAIKLSRAQALALHGALEVALGIPAPIPCPPPKVRPNGEIR